jgi:hypothetical protein
MQRLWLLAAVALLWACANDFEKQSEVRKLRVLAVAAEPAELIVQPDAGALPATTLTALAVEPNGAQVATGFSLCDVQGQLLAPDVACPGDAGLPLPDAGPQSARLDLNDPRVQAIVSQLTPGQDAGTGDAGTGDAGSPGSLAAGVALVVGLEATASANPVTPSSSPVLDGGPQSLRGFTSVPLRLAAADRPINHNPQLVDLQANGVSIAADGTTRIRASAIATLLPVPASDAKEPTPAGPERLTYSFFATDGSLSALRSTDTTSTGEPGTISVDWTAPSHPGSVRFWVVVRDDRGGAGWLIRDLQIAP